MNSKIIDKIVAINTLVVIVAFSVALIPESVVTSNPVLAQLQNSTDDQNDTDDASEERVEEIAQNLEFEYEKESKLNLHIPRVAGIFSDAFASSNGTGQLLPTTEIITNPTSAPTATPSLTPSPTLAPLEKPIRLEISSIGVNAPVETVGISENYSMEIPHDFATVGWYEPGGKPGEKGSAILNGHYDTSAGQPAVFYQLKNIKNGAEIMVHLDGGTSQKYIVTDIYSHPLEAFPTDLVYGEHEDIGLTIITCDGLWDPVLKNYSNRLVVIAEKTS